MLAVPVLVCLLLAGCASSGPPKVALSSLHPVPAPDGTGGLAATRLYTSPDGGIYVNPDSATIDGVVYGNGSDIGKYADVPAFAALSRYGRYTFVALRVRNLGAGVSSPEFSDMQIAVELAPPAAQGGPYASLYAPIFPLALLASVPVQGSCGVDINPGQTVEVVIVYPPTRPASTIVWGEYQGFVLTLPVRDHTSGWPSSLYVGKCPPAFPSTGQPPPTGQPVPSASPRATPTPAHLPGTSASGGNPQGRQG